MLANIYLHEFDFYVRHNLKPLAYVRYGDDFLLISNTKESAVRHQKLATEFLTNRLYLTLHAENNIIVSVKSGVKFLGVTSFPGSTKLSRKSMAHVKKNVNPINVDSYVAYTGRYASKKQKAITDKSIGDILILGE